MKHRLLLSTPSQRTIAGALAIVVIAVLWFATMRGILIGDDVGLVYEALHGRFARTIPQAFTMTSAEKYRPLLVMVFSLIIPLFRSNFGAYQALNIVVEIACALLVSAIVMRLTRGNQLLALMCAIAFVVSRFAYYNVMQVSGLMEGLALMFMLLSVRDAVAAFMLDRFNRLIGTVVWYAAAIFTDERYLVVGLFVVACALLHPSARLRPRTLVAVAGAAVLVLAANLGLKKFVFHKHILVGTDGHLIAFSARSALGFIAAALANFLGFNIGPDYLSGLDVAEAGAPGFVLGSLVAVPAVVLLVAFVVGAVRRRDAAAARASALGLALFIPLVITSAATIRQEFRWLYAPDAIFLIGLAAVATRIEPRRVAVGVAVVAFAACAAGSVWYRSFADNVFFMGSMRIASQVRDAIQRDPVDPVFIVHHGDRSIQNWVFYKGDFFAVYGLAGTPVTFVADVNQARGASPDILSVQWPQVLHVPTAPAATVSVLPFTRSVLSFTGTFSRGTINDTRAVETPTRRGALVVSWPGPAGEVEALTLVDTFRYRYPPARIARGMALAFYAARPTPGGDPTRAIVTVTDGAKSTPIFDEELPLPGPAGITWTRHVIDLRRFAGRAVVFTFAAENTGNPTGAWAAFGYPALVLTEADAGREGSHELSKWPGRARNVDKIQRPAR